MTPEQIRQLRERMGWTQQDLANKVHVSISTIGNWETGKVNPSKLAERALRRLAGRALRISEGQSREMIIISQSQADSLGDYSDNPPPANSPLTRPHKRNQPRSKAVLADV